MEICFRTNWLLNCAFLLPVSGEAYVQEEEIVKIPTLQLSMIDQITAKSSHVGQFFRANTLEDVTINDKTIKEEAKKEEYEIILKKK